MARTVFVRLTCDQCGGEPAETALLGFEGEPFEVDLCSTHRDTLLALLAAGRKPGDDKLPLAVDAASAPVQAAPRAKGKSKGSEPAPRLKRPGIASWAKAHPVLNYKTGRAPRYLVEAYDRYYPGPPPEDFVAPARDYRCDPCGIDFLHVDNYRRHNDLAHGGTPAANAREATDDAEPSLPAKTWAPGQYRKKEKGSKQPAKEPRPLWPALVPQTAPRELWPTAAAIKAMNDLGLSWPDVCSEIQSSYSVTPSDRPGIDQHYTASLKALVAKDGSVLGVVLRNAEDSPAPAPAPAKRIERKGKRGGIGNVKPKTTDEIIALVEATPGWEWSHATNGHLAITGPQGQRCQIAATPSDHRTGRNDFARLRRIGLATG